MKICMNAIGFTEEKKLRTAELLIGGGSILAGIGVLASIAGLILIQGSQRWYVASTNDHFELISNVHKTLDEMMTEG